MQRYDSIDVVRTIAIILMVPCHFILFLSPYEVPYIGVYTFGNEILGGLAAPLFLFLVGTSQAISLSRSTQSKQLLDSTGIKMIQRGVIIFIIGLLFQLPLEGAIYDWDVLPLIGASMIVLCFLRKAPLKIILLCSCLIFFISPWLRGVVGYLNYWEPHLTTSLYADGFPSIFMDPLYDYSYASDPRLSKAFIGFFVTGYFPFFPWMIFPLSGYLFGKIHYVRQNSGNGGKVFTGLGILFILIGSGIAFYARRFGSANFESGFVTTLTFFPITPAWLMIQLGTCLVLTVFCGKIFDHKVREGVFLRYCRLISRYSLSIYLLHYLIAYWTPRMMGIYSGDEFGYLRNVMNPIAAWIFALFVLMSFYFLFSQWDLKKGKFSLEWLLRKASA